MEQSTLAEVGLPLVVFLVMTAVGLSLDQTDFVRLLRRPRALAVGLASQLVALPVLGFAVAWFFRFDAVLATSVVLLAAAPGGAMSNVIVHLADSERALSVSLTVCSSLFTWLSIPLLLQVAFDVFGGAGGAVEVPFLQTMAQVAGITLVPVSVGMAWRAWRPGFAERTRKHGRIFAGAALLVIVFALVVENLALVVEEGPRLMPALAVLNAAALAVGYGAATVAKLRPSTRMTVALETGIQNAAVAISVALVTLDVAEMSVIPGLYGLWMLVTGAAFAGLMMRRGTDRLEIPTA